MDRRSLSLGLLLAALVLAVPALPAGAQSSSLKDLLGSLWARLRAATPRATPTMASSTVTAGLRGTEATESELKPYWKDDREQDPAAVAERQALDQAQSLADAGNYAEAGRAFDAFVQANPRSPLAPNALFGAALARAALGDRSQAASGLETFLKQNPQHPLARDAEQALAALR
jgi:TolA-binding protein